jgi:SPP1 gp7 family putative phage head morphogenesis protein
MADDADAVTARPFGVRFDEAIGFLKGKLPEASLSWDSLAGPVHAKVFTVAGATSADLARDLQQALVDAKAQGQTITAFRKAFDATVQRYGWTYNGKRGWRTRVIFDTNMRTAHMAGRWQQLVANADRRPYLQYRTAGDARVRPQHRQWAGRIYPIGDAFWSTHYPPNGWGCRCTVRAYSEAEMQSKGLSVAEPLRTGTRDVRRDGQVVDRVPVGIDPGWDHNVGRAWIAPELALGEKLARLPAELRGPLVDKTITPAYLAAIRSNWVAFAGEVAKSGRPRSEAQIVGFLDSRVLGQLGSQVPDLDLESTAIAVLDRRTAHLAGRHKAKANPQQVWPQEWIDDLPSALRNYQAVFWDTELRTLVVVPQGQMPNAPGRIAKVVLKPNVAAKGGSSLQVISLGSAQPSDLTGPGRYVLLTGRLQ